FCGLLLATHPVLARFSPTDGPYALLLFTWFWGLALLSASPLTERGLWAGTALLGIAATTRIEGVVLLIASVALVGRRHVLAAVRRAPDIALCALLIVAALITVQMYFLLPFYLGGPGAVVAAFVLATHHADLSKPYVFNTEYDLVRRHLGPAGGVPNDCALMTFSSLIHMDLDLKSFEQVVPDRTVIDCGRADCVSQLRDGRCYYYVRSAASYFHENGIP